MRILLSAVLIWLPLAVAPGLLFYFDITPKIFLLLFAAAAAAVWLPWERTRSRAPLPFVILLAAFLLSCAASTLLSGDPSLSFTGTNWRRLGLVTWTGIVVLTAAVATRGPAGAAYLFRGIALGGAPVALYGVLQWFGWDPWLPASAYHIGDPPWTIVRPPGTLGYVTYFANYLLGVLFASVGLFLVDDRRLWRIIGAFAAGLCVCAIVLSGTRAAMLGILAGFLVLLLLLRPRVPVRPAAVAAVVCIVLGAAFYLSPAGLKLRNRTRWYLEDPAGGARLWLWRDSARMALDAPFTGFGLETFSLEFPRRRSPELSRLYPDFHYESAHNIFLDTLTAQGIPGLLIFGSLVGWAFYVAVRIQNGRRRLAATLASSLAALVVAHQFACFVAPTAFVFFVNLALIASIQVPLIASPRRLPVVVAVPVAAGLVWFAVSLVVADRMLMQTKQYLEQARPKEAIETYARVAEWAPPGMSADLWYSRFLMQAALKSSSQAVGSRAALDAARRAVTESEERHNAWYNLAALSALAGDAAMTERCLRSAIAASPNWYKPHWTLARLLERTGRFKEAELEAALAVDLNGGRNSEVLQTFNAVRARRNTSVP